MQNRTTSKREGEERRVKLRDLLGRRKQRLLSGKRVDEKPPASGPLRFRHCGPQTFFRVAAWSICFLVTGLVAAAQTIDFDTQVIPLLTRHGCNAGACHGAAIGRGGFRLSLFGSDAATDRAAIAGELEGRRVNLSDPARSLLLRKATETVEHGGGERFHEETDAYHALAQWISEGARRTGTRQLIRLDVAPQQALLERLGDSVTLAVTAHFSDGQVEEVTRWAVITSDDPGSLEIDQRSHRLVIRRRGEHTALVRYLDQVLPVRVAVPLHDELPSGHVLQPSGRDAADDPWIDRPINSQLRRLRIPASQQADDQEFLRRIWLDLCGRLPAMEEVARFLSDMQPNRRERLIDRLLETDAFADYWALKWANILRIDSGQLQPQGAEAFHRWIAQRLRRDAPWDEAAIEMLTATGDGYTTGPVNFLRIGGGPEGLAEHASRVFMGVRMQCANCHNHPLDHWQQDDYHGLAAVFAKLSRGRNVAISSRGEVTHPVTGEAAVPRIPGGHSLADSADPRIEFARWIADPENPHLARATVNRVWRELMGRGLIEPVDDIRDTNPASHPELLDELAQRFVAEGFRFKPLIREICRSEVYQRSGFAVPENQTDATYYSHFRPRPLEAEVVADAIAWVTGVPLQLVEPTTLDEKTSSNQGSSKDGSPALGGEFAVQRAIRISDNRLASIGLDLLGRCDRSEGCESSPSGAESLARVLHFLNSDLLNAPVSAPGGVLQRWLQTEPDRFVIAERLYQRALTRSMNEAERDHWRQQLQGDGGSLTQMQAQELLEDLLWALLTSNSFLTNH